MRVPYAVRMDSVCMCNENRWRPVADKKEWGKPYARVSVCVCVCLLLDALVM